MIGGHLTQRMPAVLMNSLVGMWDSWPHPVTTQRNVRCGDCVEITGAVVALIQDAIVFCHVKITSISFNPSFIEGEHGKTNSTFKCKQRI